MMLKEFFIDENITIPFKLFGKTHLFLMFFVLLFWGILFFKKKKIYQLKDKTKRGITVFFAIILLINMLVLYVSSFYYHSFDYKTMLPLHLCYISNYFYIFVILFHKKRLYQYIYFLAFLGPIPAIVFFDVPSVWESFNFYLYVISHHLLVIAGLFTFYMYPMKIKLKSIGFLIIVLNILYFIMTIFNYYFQTNYFFSEAIPEFILELFPFLKFIPIFVVLEVVEIMIMLVLYLFFKREYSLLKA